LAQGRAATGCVNLAFSLYERGLWFGTLTTWPSGCGWEDFVVYCEIVPRVLGRVITGEITLPRGPDALHRIRVPKSWLEQGSVIELELPRNLTCRSCEGGGCDVCERSGAVTLRDRGAPPDLVEVTLPARPQGDSFVIRIPERGGLARADSGLPRGLLLLRVEPSEGSDPSSSVSKVVPDIPLARRALDEPAVEAPARPWWVFSLAVAIGLALGLALWLYLRSR
jgi:hypothetical protein